MMYWDNNLSKVIFAGVGSSGTKTPSSTREAGSSSVITIID